ncbi:hypothetical protein KRH_18080 [Kocuria rhizophila DC2201]|uniref:Uncharacterized protein n=1 Tax=Kocuria rhizophila (strain ATCC 9341 / DSM 348 / NBRC 103217 / DC2201) TaxID=378753 RepID=B2GM39_KOCRD|nr:hypothetical protein KRH_18080 [Kocuria rhizophila DC2201]
MTPGAAPGRRWLSFDDIPGPVLAPTLAGWLGSNRLHEMHPREGSTPPHDPGSNPVHANPRFRGGLDDEAAGPHVWPRQAARKLRGHTP